jgi:peptidyl-prolyl cis-trans isomerase C
LFDFRFALRLLGTALLASSALAAVAQGTPPAEVLARVNGQPVTRVLMEQMVRSRHAPNPFDEATGIAPPPAPVDRPQLFDELLTLEVLAQQAITRGLHREPSITAQRELQIGTVLSQQVVRGLIAQVQVSPAEVAALYEKEVPPYDFKLGRIVVADKTQAQALIARLRRGEPFAKLARQHVADPAQRTAPWLMFNQMEPAVATAVSSLTPGTVAEQPVAVEGGWAVLRLEARRSAPRPPLSEASVWLKARLLSSKVQARLDQMRREAKVEVLPAASR